MKYKNHFTSSVRIANFSKLQISAQYLLAFDSNDPESIVKEIRRHADLPYVYAVSGEQMAQIPGILSLLKQMRSPCYPYAVFILGDDTLATDAVDLDIIKCPGGTADTLKKRIDEYSALKFNFDTSTLCMENASSLPDKTDVFIVGAGITGIYAANRLLKNGLSFCVADKRDKIGGIWSMYANSSSRVNTSESAYRLMEKEVRTNRDHSATREILEDIATLGNRVSEDIYLNTEVEKIEKISSGYRIRVNRGGQTQNLESKGVILAINDRVGASKKIEFSNQSVFQGRIVSGISDNTRELNWKDKDVVIVGMGAFAIENARTALELGARHVTLICRKHGTVCPKIIDYLNFATPYDDEFKHDNKSNFLNMVYWKKMYELSGATQPECWMGKIKHSGHTISVSDIWFVGHYLKKIETITGEITKLLEKDVVINDNQTLKADIIVNCIGFERNGSSAKSLCNYNEIYNSNYVDKDFIYLADAYIDDNAFNSFFGSSVLEMVKFYLEIYINYFDNPEYEKMKKIDGIYKIPIEDRKWSHYIKGAQSLIKNNPLFYEVAKKQVSQRTKNFFEKHDLETYINENKREWIDLHSMLTGESIKEKDCLPYVFEKLLPKSNI